MYPNHTFHIPIIVEESIACDFTHEARPPVTCSGGIRAKNMVCQSYTIVTDALTHFWVYILALKSQSF